MPPHQDQELFLLLLLQDQELFFLPHHQDLELLFTIVRLLYEEGYTLEGAERKLRKGWPPKRNNSGSRERSELVRIRRELQEILQLLEG